MASDFQVGPIAQAQIQYDGGFRVAQDGPLVTTDDNARFYEGSSRYAMWSARASLVGTTLASAFVAPPAAAASTLLSVLNPVGSGVNLEILQGWVAITAGTTLLPAGFWAWCGGYQGTAITAAEAVAVKSNLLVGQQICRAKAWSASALTGGKAQILVRPFPLCNFAAPLAGTTDQIIMTDNVDGALVVPPGCLITIAPPATGTSTSGTCGMMWQEVPRPEGPEGEPL